MLSKTLHARAISVRTMRAKLSCSIHRAIYPRRAPSRLKIIWEQFAGYGDCPDNRSASEYDLLNGAPANSALTNGALLMRASRRNILARWLRNRASESAYIYTYICIHIYFYIRD